MSWYEILFACYVGISGLLQILLFTYILVEPDDNIIEGISEIVNPVIIYRNYKVNWFGCLMLTLLGNAAYPLFAVIYWLYCLGWLFCKLCTVGRK